VKERFAVKIGYPIPPLEAENMKFVAANSNVSVPKVHANFVDPETQKRYIVMDFVPGTDLQKITTIAHISREDDGQRADQRDNQRTTNNTTHRTTLET
jgi:hypothetical protein